MGNKGVGRRSVQHAERADETAEQDRVTVFLDGVALLLGFGSVTLAVLWRVDLTPRSAFVPTLVGVGFLTGCYLAARNSHYRIGAWCCVVSLPLVACLLAVLTPRNPEWYSFTVLGPLLAIGVLPLRQAWVAAGLSVTSVWLFALSNPSISIHEATVVLSFATVTPVLLLLFAAGRCLAGSEAETSLSRLLEASPTGIVRLTPGGCVELANPAAAGLLDVDLSLLRCSTLSEHPFFTASQRTELNGALRALSQRANSDVFELSLEAANLQPSRSVQLRARALDSSGRVGVTLIDVTAQRDEKRLREQSARSLRSSALGELAVGIAHEFGNSLQLLEARAYMAARKMPDSLTRELEEMRQEIQTAAVLVRRLVAFANVGPSPVDTSVNTNTALTELASTLSRLLRGHRLQLSLGARVGPVRVSLVDFESIVVSLILLTRSSGPDGATIQVTTREVVLPDEDGSINAPVCELFFSVDDRGRPGEHQASTHPLADPYARAVASIIGRVGGRLEVEGSPTLPRAIRVYLPLSERTEGPAAVPNSDWAWDQTAIVLMEPNDAVRGAVRQAVEMLGAKVYEADTPAEAVQLVRTQDIALVIADPFGCAQTDGDSFVEMIRRQRPSLPIVLVSSPEQHYAEQHYAEQQYPAQSNVYFLRKPFSVETLQAVVGRQTKQV